MRCEQPLIYALQKWRDDCCQKIRADFRSMPLLFRFTKPSYYCYLLILMKKIRE